MEREPFHVAFYDSSDDEQNEHVTQIVPVVDGVSPQTTPSTRDENDHPEEEKEQQEQGQQRQEQRSSWLGRIANGTTAFLSYAFGGGNGANADDSHDAGSRGYGSHDNDRWGYNAHRDVARRSVELQDAESFAPSEEIAIDLRETILQYKRTPDDVYMRIILAALNFGEVQVGGDLFLAAYGNNDLMKVLMESGRVNYDDPGVQEIIQEEIDSIIVPDASCGGSISPDQIGYLALLCHAPNATLTMEQVRLFRHAGFEFVKMLYENPHLLRNLPPPRWIVARILDICYFLDMVVTWLGLIATLINLACIWWIVVFWLSRDMAEADYWTILCYVLCYVVSIVAVMVSEEGRIRDYEDRLWDYPDNTLKVIPCIPLFEIALMYVTLRYEILRDKAKYFVIRYDLYNGLTNVLIVDTLLFATSQYILQYYMFNLYGRDLTDHVGYKIFAGVNYVLYGMSMYLAARKIFSNYSCNGFGFAVMAVSRSVVTPFGAATRMLIVMTIFYLQCNLISISLSLSNISMCDAEYKIFIIVAAVVTALEVVVLVVMFVLGVSSLVTFVCVPVVVVQISFSVYMALKNDEVNVVCTLFAFNSPLVSLLKHLTFGFLCASLIFCIIAEGLERLTGWRLLPYCDNYYYWIRSDKGK